MSPVPPVQSRPSLRLARREILLNTLLLQYAFIQQQFMSSSASAPTYHMPSERSPHLQTLMAWPDANSPASQQSPTQTEGSVARGQLDAGYKLRELLLVKWSDNCAAVRRGEDGSKGCTGLAAPVPGESDRDRIAGLDGLCRWETGFRDATVAGAWWMREAMEQRYILSLLWLIER